MPLKKKMAPGRAAPGARPPSVPMVTVGSIIQVKAHMGAHGGKKGIVTR
jgi:hypothetical protein